MNNVELQMIDDRCIIPAHHNKFKTRSIPRKRSWQSSSKRAQVRVEIDTLKEHIDFDGCLGSRRKGLLSTLASSVETTDSTRV